MAIDREDTLKKAEKLLRQGQLDAAIAEYVRVVEDSPRDWNTAQHPRRPLRPRRPARPGCRAVHAASPSTSSTRASIPRPRAHLQEDPQDQAGRRSRRSCTLAEISRRQGLLADAKAHLNAVAARRRERGDKAGAAEIVVRLGSLDPADFDARALAARTLDEMGDDEAPPRGSGRCTTTCWRRAAMPRRSRRCARRSGSIPHDQEARADPGQSGGRRRRSRRRARRFSIARPPATIRRC